MIQLVNFICPDCGKMWIEGQDIKDDDDDWYGLATKQALCEDCVKIKIWLHNSLNKERNNAST